MSKKSTGTIITHSSINAKTTDKAESQSDEWASCGKDYFKTTGAPANKNRNNDEIQNLNNTTKPDYKQNLKGNF